MKKFLPFALLLIASACTGGYSFTGGDVGNAKTVSVDFFPNYSNLVQPQLSQIFTERLRDVFIRQTPLNLVQTGGDMHIEGSIVEYTIDPINAQANAQAQVAQNRLTIAVNVIFTNKLEPDKSFEKQFTRYDDFPSDQDISSVQDELHEKLSQELSENILNEAVGNW